MFWLDFPMRVPYTTSTLPWVVADLLVDAHWCIFWNYNLTVTTRSQRPTSWNMHKIILKLDLHPTHGLRCWFIFRLHNVKKCWKILHTPNHLSVTHHLFVRILIANISTTSSTMLCSLIKVTWLNGLIFIIQDYRCQKFNRVELRSHMFGSLPAGFRCG